ncbi:MAG: hypothetical protein J6Y19_06095, partial [Kiritimatiellae bacterium]|nr:hypothetical protein [Kiritimatiellia bacterium]
MMGKTGFHAMEACLGHFSTQWKHVSRIFPHNGSMFRHVFHTMESSFAAGFHGVEKILRGAGSPQRWGGSGG